uniref:Uncharacterized protein n=1 Tax=Globodera pallida TaxID=36090 RepID=A0A183CJ35_GLOPA
MISTTEGEEGGLDFLAVTHEVRSLKKRLVSHARFEVHRHLRRVISAVRQHESSSRMSIHPEIYTGCILEGAGNPTEIRSAFNQFWND